MSANDESMTTLASMLNAMTHSERIDLRLSKANKELIERAASIEDISVSAFVVANALFNAKIVVADHERWLLSRRDSAAFVDAVLNPPEPNDAMRAVAERYTRRSTP